ncbi:uroporphyrinogen-III C-methyltransferase [Haloplanus sp.]|uniref:uroporphyrinogen-III C-methyltransferase n=1 Tax=Haloplanus sp. TaxID=1961696 RepID=UPI002611F275|nr:uroporphyrinogen-III C-methyltransferase [Haloplanus sp.]
MRPGTVYLVGAGPGDPELMTVKARRVLDGAAVVYHDSLVSEAVIESIPDATRLVGVDECSDGERASQAEITRPLVRRATAGEDVVRLRSGDPCVFGRGGEEAEHLASAGIPFEIVPGVTGAVAGPGVAGIPPTHRDHASSVTVVTGYEDPTEEHSALDWTALARSVTAGGTLIIPMGVARPSDTVAALREGGVDPGTPVAVVEDASRASAFTVTGTTETITDRTREVGTDPPAVTVVGDVVSVRDRVFEFLHAGGTARQSGGTAGDGSPISTE